MIAMERNLFRFWVLLVGTMVIPPATLAQQAGPVPALLISPDLALTYSVERAKIADSSCKCFWLSGASAETDLDFYHGLGLLAEINGSHVNNIRSGVDLSKIAFMVGPRYTLHSMRWANIVTRSRSVDLFTEALFGFAHAFDSTFPSSTGAKSNATAFSMQIGGGIDIAFARGFSLRLPEVDYVRTSFPNDTSDTQNDLRLAVGVNWHLPRRSQLH